MKIFGTDFDTKKGLKQTIDRLRAEVLELEDALYRKEDMFPFYLGQTVYEIAFKNEKGRYTKKDPSFEHSEITEIEVTEKNYFKLVKRYENDDVFCSRDGAELYLEYICNFIRDNTESYKDLEEV